jgi:cytochrome P450
MAVVQLICEYPEVKQKLVDLLMSDESQGLVYLDQIIKESFRLKPPVTIIPAHVVNDAFEFNGVKLQKGDSVLIAPYVCHHNPKIWNEPTLFDPERFSKENERKIPHGAYLPFGLGDRQCPGSNYALAVLKTYLVKLFREFDVHIENHLSQQDLKAARLYPRHSQ